MISVVTRHLRTITSVASSVNVFLCFPCLFNVRFPNVFSLSLHAVIILFPRCEHPGTVRPCVVQLMHIRSACIDIVRNAKDPLTVQGISDVVMS